MEVLRISTAGSVDDGKSTLIGRLLYETNSITVDKLEAIERASQRKGIGFLDLSLLTDGLIAEREQGITIDVAHIYFHTRNRKFIITDAPGHVEYTRNMITGASKADVSIILIDARKGVLEQTHRHYFISNLLRISKVIVCVNKMDLVGFEEGPFREIEKTFLDFAKEIQSSGPASAEAGSAPARQDITVMPVSSLLGDNITRKSESMAWFKGEPLLAILESIQVNTDLDRKPVRFPVQYVIRPRNESHHDFRGYAGRMLSGRLRVGDEVIVQPSGRKSKVSRISFFDKELQEATAKESVVVELADNVDVSRGDWLVPVDQSAALRTELEANICWLNAEPFNAGKVYLLQQGTSISKAKVTQINYVQVPSTLEKTTPTSLKMNDIASVKIKAAKPLLIDNFDENKSNGAFILVDEYSNNTVAVGVAL
ncbi:MAG TPA: GTP-binding protein [Cyclobacteriaceae bacterium]|nr:GTP-binding protein [Cyclobacteriaceae bacterium]